MSKLFAKMLGSRIPAGAAAPAPAAAAKPVPAPAVSFDEEIAALEPIVNKTKQEKKQVEAEAAALIKQQQIVSNTLGQAWGKANKNLEAEMELLELEVLGAKGRRGRKSRRVHKRKSRKQRNYGTRRRS